VYIVPVVRGPGKLDMRLYSTPEKLKASDEVLFVDWDIQFL
jgi:hypothetical protein